MGWSSFPPPHRKSLLRAVALYAFLVAGAGGWIFIKADATIKDWEKRTPHAVATVKNIYGAGVTGDAHDDTQKPPEFAPDVQLPPAAPGEGFVTIIMTDMGVSDADTKRAMEDLPADMTLAFSPYSPNMSEWLQRAKEANRETLVLIPMEPANYPKDDPGPQALSTRNSDADNTRRLDWALRQAGGAVGAMNFMGSGMLGDEKNLTGLLNTLYKRSSIFVENPQGGESMAEQVAEQTNTPYLQADVQIDKRAAELDVKQQLVALENIAKQRGYAVGVAQPYPVTFSILKSWAASLEARGIKLVPLTVLWKAKQRKENTAPPAPAPTLSP